jgi:hypothetical protein
VFKEGIVLLFGGFFEDIKLDSFNHISGFLVKKMHFIHIEGTIELDDSRHPVLTVLPLLLVVACLK